MRRSSRSTHNPRSCRQPLGRRVRVYGQQHRPHVEAARGSAGRQLNKLKTFEASTGDLSPRVISPGPHLCFIDGEHTGPAAAGDADFCRSVVRVPGLIAFHDTPVVAPAIGRFLDHSGGFGYRLRDLVFVVEFGGRRIFNHPLVVERMTFHRSEWIWANRIGVAGRMVREASPVEAVRPPLRDPHAAAAIARPGVTLAPGGARVPGSAPDLAAALTTHSRRGERPRGN